MLNEKILDISWKTIIKISLAVVVFYIFYSVKDIFVWFIFALIISVLLNPAIDFLQRKRIPRTISALSVYFSIFGSLSFLIWLIIPLLVSETNQFLQAFPQYFEKVSPLLKGLGLEAFRNIESFVNSLVVALDSMKASILNVVFAIFGGIFSTIFVVTAAIFLSLEEKVVEKTLLLVFPKRYENLALNLWLKSQKKVAGWFGARLLACLFVGLASGIVFIIFNVKYPYVLALFAGVFNFVPFIGPFLTGIVLFLLIFPAEALKALFVLIVFVLIQQVENNILSPILMKKIVNIPPVLVLVSLVVGAKLWGFLGSLLIIPLAGILFEFTKDFLQKRKERESVEIQ